jgi:hypothetical protein
MRRYLPALTALTMCLMSTAVVPSLKASESDEKTTVTLSRPVAVQGTILLAGRYVLRRQTGAATPDVVFIFNGDETRLVATVLAMRAYRLSPSDKSELSLYESRAGEPVALHTWFYPGENDGFEFLQARTR